MIRTHSGSLAAGGLYWDSLPLKLFAGGNAKFWDPADIDFSRDRADWEKLADDERHLATRLCAQFIAGEEAVTEDIQPFMAAMRAEGRLGDEMYLTQFAFEEAKHTQVFRLWLDAVGITEDLHGYLDELVAYRQIFYQELPECLSALTTDPSPAAHGHGMRSEAREIGCGLGAGMRTAADHAQRSLRRARMNTALRRITMPAEGAHARGTPIH